MRLLRRLSLPALLLAGVVAGATTQDEVFVKVDPPSVVGGIALSTRGSSAFRVRFLTETDQGPIDSPMVAPADDHIPYRLVDDPLYGTGIGVDGLGSVYVNGQGISLVDASGKLISRSLGIAAGAGPDGGVSLTLEKVPSSRLYGRGASNLDSVADQAIGLGFKTTSSSATIFNKATYVPYYYSTEGYAALGVGSVTRFNELLVGYGAAADGASITWTCKGPFELYLMPADTLLAGTQAYFALTGLPPVPPLYTFGFIASRWGWSSRAYVEETLGAFRSGRFPIDAFIIDFEWFANHSDYAFSPAGTDWYDDFGYNPFVFPNPKEQLAEYRSNLHVRFGGIRKPRLGNAENLKLAKANGWLAPEGGPETYATDRWLLFEQQAMRDWYKERQVHYRQDGVDFWWNDEGENQYYTYHWWNSAQLEERERGPHSLRFYSLNRAFSPGMARLGANVWTGDIKSTWADLSRTPSIMLNWGLAGAPYVACDIGGFYDAPPDDQLMPRFYQVGVFLPIMRVHSEISQTPRFPWLWGEAAATVMRQAVELRYRLIPYHYSLAHAMSATGALWMRPLVMDFPDDERVANLTSQWLDGGILAAPVLRSDSAKEVYLPEGRWYPFGSPCDIEGPTDITGQASLDEIPAYVRAGSIVTLAPLVQSTAEFPGGPLEVQVYSGADGEFLLVEDDGETMAYEGGDVRAVSFTWDEAAGTIDWEVYGSHGGPKAFKQLFITLFDRGTTLRSDVLRIEDAGSLRASSLRHLPVSSGSSCPQGAGAHRRLDQTFV